MTTVNRKLKVFLCHSKDDKPKVRELYRHLVADGFDAWLDEEKLMPGQDWDLEIRKAVRESDVVVVCLSKSSVTKAGYFQKEIRFALDVADEQPEGAIFIIPARLEECDVPTRLKNRHWVNLFEDHGTKPLITSLKRQAETLGIIRYRTLEFEPQMIRIPAGKFLMGSTKEQIAQAIKEGADEARLKNEMPQHTVELSEYYIGKYPITNHEYKAFLYDTKNSPSPFGDIRPVINISWDDANDYCKWLSEKAQKNYRLATEAEWEKAARGEDGRIYPWGNDFDLGKANTREANLGDTTDVGKFSPQGDSPFGCADMVGNVYEWCGDWFNGNEYKQRQGTIVKNPQGPQTGISRVYHGSAFYNDRWVARCATRNGLIPTSPRNAVGFRVVLSSFEG